MNGMNVCTNKKNACTYIHTHVYIHKYKIYRKSADEYCAKMPFMYNME